MIKHGLSYPAHVVPSGTAVEGGPRAFSEFGAKKETRVVFPRRLPREKGGYPRVRSIPLHNKQQDWIGSEMKLHLGSMRGDLCFQRPSD